MSQINKETFIYFAYGSNMLNRRIKATERAPSAFYNGIGFVKGYKLTFNKLSSDRSGKCNIELTDNPTDKVYGVLFKIDKRDKPKLDKAEKGYKEKTVDVMVSSGLCNAVTYVASEINPGLQPYHWYKAVVICGAIEHGLPSEYIEWLRTFISMNDPDVNRRSKNENILFTS